ncbi:hypothetical protein FJZ27_05335 [Candidatus Peribacteria bacterium]|nr:hypothetical protein [Candidatus Peribacteria bacterium]
MRSKVLLSTAILTCATALGVSDAYFVEGGLPQPALGDETMAGDQTSSQPSDAGSASGAGGVRKALGPDVLTLLTTQGFERQDSNELSILRTVIPSQEATVSQYVLLTGGDRAGLIAWTESPNVKHYFLALKEALHASFSPHIKDLRDEAQRLPGKPPRNFLTFFDVALSPERIVFLRVRERLYEIRVTEGHEEAIFALVDALTQ